MGETRNTQEQDINQLLKVRREKLAALQENGKDPFLITKYDVDAAEGTGFALRRPKGRRRLST